MIHFISFLVIVTSPFAIVGAMFVSPTTFVATAATYAFAYATLLGWNFIQLVYATAEMRS